MALVINMKARRTGQASRWALRATLGKQHILPWKKTKTDNEWVASVDLIMFHFFIKVVNMRCLLPYPL